MTAKVVVVQEAEQQLLEIDSWWVEHRQSVLDLFLNELSRAFDLLEEMLRIGSVFREANQPGVRVVGQFESSGPPMLPAHI